MREHRTPYKDLTEEQKMRADARSIAKVYLKRGRILREDCEVCGKPGEEMHHDDYTRPLFVRWFCREHHVDLHMQEK